MSSHSLYATTSVESTSLLKEATTPFMKKFVIVLAHGLGMTHEYVKYLGDQLKEREYGDYDEPIIILLRSSEGNLSFDSIEIQALRAINEINEVLRNDSMLPIVLIGHSQGALRVEKIKELTENMEDFKHNIISIIDISGLFQGVPVLNTSLNEFNRFWEKSEQGLRKVCKHADRLFWKERCMICLILPFARWRYAGIGDMRSESKFLKGIKNFIQYDSTPRMFIAGSATDFNLLFGTENDSDIKQFEKAYAAWITGKEDGDHDVLIPIDSQLGNNIDNPLIERTIIPKVVHASHLVPLNMDCFLTLERMQTTGVVEEVVSMEVIEKAYDFIKRHVNHSCLS